VLDHAPKLFEAALLRQLGRDGCAQKAFALHMGKSEAWVSRLKDAGDPTHIRASDVVRALQAVGSVEPLNELLRGERIGGRRHRVAPEPDVVPPEDLRLDAMELVGGIGIYIAALGRALADGDLGRGELAELDRHLVELERQVAAQHADIRGRLGARR